MLSSGFSDRLLGVQDPNLQFWTSPLLPILRGALDMRMSVGIKGELRASDLVGQNERSDHPFTKRSGDMVYTSVLD